MSLVTASLKAAAAHAEKLRWEAALGALLAAWERQPARELADAIFVIEEALGHEGFVGDTEAWLAAAARVKPTGRGPLLATLRGPTVWDVQRRLTAITSWADDPRTARALEALLTDVPWTANNSKYMWESVFSLVAASGSPRFVELAAQLPARWKVRAAMKTWLVLRLERAVAQLPRLPPELDPSDRALLGKLHSALKATEVRTAARAPARRADEAALLAQIWARPADDEPRLVYADVLQERGDPRGEFIVLQCRASDPKREKALLAKHGKAWLGALAPVLGPRFEFRRGFVAVASVKFRHQLDAEKFVELPDWATLEELTWQGRSVEQATFQGAMGPAMRWLKRAHGPYVPHLFAAGEPWDLELLQARFRTPHLLQQAFTSPSLPRLHTVWVDDDVVPAWFAKVKSLGPVKVLRLNVSQWAVPAWAEVIASISGLEATSLQLGTFLRLERGRDGRLSKATLQVTRVNLRELPWFLEQLPTKGLESLEHELGPGARLPEGLEKKVRALLRPSSR